MISIHINGGRGIEFIAFGKEIYILLGFFMRGLFRIRIGLLDSFYLQFLEIISKRICP